MRKIRKFSDFLNEKIEWAHYRFNTQGEREVADVAEETLQSTQLCVIEPGDKGFEKLEQTFDACEPEMVLETDRHNLSFCKEPIEFLKWERLGSDGEPIEHCFIVKAADTSTALNEARREEMTTLTERDIEFMKKIVPDEKTAIEQIVACGYELLEPKNNTRTADAIFRDKYGRRYVSYSNGYVRHIQPKHYINYFSKEKVEYMSPLVDYMIPDRFDRLLVILRNALKKAGLWKEWTKNRAPLKDWMHSKRGRIQGRKLGI